MRDAEARRLAGEAQAQGVPAQALTLDGRNYYVILQVDGQPVHCRRTADVENALREEA